MRNQPNRQQHVTFKTQELSNTVWAYAVLYSDNLLGSIPEDHHISWKPTVMLDAGTWFSRVP